ncbi:MAG: hypothetical protein WBW41_18150 [Verrucomicrobiia bacterium]
MANNLEIEKKVMAVSMLAKVIPFAALSASQTFTATPSCVWASVLAKAVGKSWIAECVA